MKSLRQYEIVEWVRGKKFCSLTELMQQFNISSATIHRDILDLVKTRQLRKVHGGVAAVETIHQLPTYSAHYRNRLIANREAKQIIAEAAIQEIQDGDVIFLDSSTTVYYLAKLLQSAMFTNLTVVTNSLLIIQEFSLFPPGIFLIALGGNYDSQLNAFLGKATMRESDCIIGGKAFFSGLGMTISGVFSRHESHAELLQNILNKTKQNYLLIGSDKFERNGPFPIAPLSRIYRIISETEPPGYWLGV